MREGRRGWTDDKGEGESEDGKVKMSEGERWEGKGSKTEEDEDWAIRLPLLDAQRNKLQKRL